MKRDGLIAAIGYDDQVAPKYRDDSFDRIIDASGSAVLPGLVDAHTHPVWAGDRVHEFSMKVRPQQPPGGHAPSDYSRVFFSFHLFFPHPEANIEANQQPSRDAVSLRVFFLQQIFLLLLIGYSSSAPLTDEMIGS